MKWKTSLLTELQNIFERDDNWKTYSEKLKDNPSDIAIHLAIFSEQLMNKLIKGEKTVESRFSLNNVSPFGRIVKGDLVVVKKSGGPVTAMFVAGTINSYHDLTPKKITALKIEHSLSLGLALDDAFWEEKLNSKFATFIKVDKLKPTTPFIIEKKDRTGWVVVKPRYETMLF